MWHKPDQPDPQDSTSSDAEQKRSFARIRTRLDARLRPADSPQAEAVRLDVAQAQGPGVKALASGSLPEALVGFLASLDRKLDLIISLFSQERLEADFPDRAQVVEISGSGLRFVSPKPYPVQEPLELVLMLSRVPLRLAAAVGVVLSSDPAEDGRGYEHAFTFTSIREADLEAVVSFVFQEERARIREAKWGE